MNPKGKWKVLFIKENLLQNFVAFPLWGIWDKTQTEAHLKLTQPLLRAAWSSQSLFSLLAVVIRCFWLPFIEFRFLSIRHGAPYIFYLLHSPSYSLSLSWFYRSRIWGPEKESHLLKNTQLTKRWQPGNLCSCLSLKPGVWKLHPMEPLEVSRNPSVTCCWRGACGAGRALAPSGCSNQSSLCAICFIAVCWMNAWEPFKKSVHV